jgi:hypothetical protein
MDLILKRLSQGLRPPIGNEVWERISASMIAAGKPLPRITKKRATSLEAGYGA